MNTIMVHGRLTEAAKIVLVDNQIQQVPMAVFQIEDRGLPYQKSEPMTVEVHYRGQIAAHIVNELVKGKEVTVIGHLAIRRWNNRNNIKAAEKLYISADYVTLIPLYRQKGDICG